MVELENVVKQFSSDTTIPPALDGITAKIQQGIITGLVGADGSGKTTLLRIIAGLLTVTSGKVRVEGLDPEHDIDSLRFILGYMPQKFGLYEDLTVIENLVLYADLRGVLGEKREKIFKQLLDFTALGPFTSRRAGNLSGGMKQKLGLACALLGEPKVLLLDEPSVGVDPISRRELWKMVNVLATKGMSVVWSTAYLSEAELCEEVLVLDKGKLIYSGSPQTLTDTMTGRTYQVQEIEGNHRLVLQNGMRAKQVMDGVIQGSHVRLVMKKKGELPDLSSLEAGPHAKLIAVPPRFEDAFVDLVGGTPESPLLFSKNKIAQDNKLPEVVIKAENLTKKFGPFTAVNGINFEVKRGEVFCLLGPNGAGKSTTFKMMCGLLMPTSGTASILGYDLLKDPHRARQQLGYMAQKFSLYGDLTVQENLQFFSGIYGLTGEHQEKTIAEMIQVFDLHSFLKTKTNDLPLGFKQRLALACAIMHKPSLLFLDEPTSGVDPIARREFWAHINELVENGVTIVVTTHFMEEAEYCDHMALVYRGQIIAKGTPEKLKKLAVTKEQPDPTMEDAFIDLIIKHDQENKNSVDNQFTEKKIPQQKIPAAPLFLKNHPSLLRLYSLCQKESYQIVRDPSSIFMAFILPLLLLFIYGYGINLDTKVRLGLVMEDQSPEARSFAASYQGSPYIDFVPMLNQDKAGKALTAGDIRGFVTIQSDFTKRLKQAGGQAPVLIVTDGSEPNTANFVTAYAKGVWQTWLNIRAIEFAKPYFQNIKLETRFWFNPDVISRQFIVPGSIVIVMTVIGALLTSLVVAREWERGTMEALLSAPITRFEFLASKFIPYYILGIIAMVVCTITAVTVLQTPFRGSFLILFIQTTLFLASVLGLGLLLSTVLRNQFNSAQAALNIAYLPAILLSGYVFEISSMPYFVQGITYLFPARYFIASLKTLFLAGNVGILLLENALFLFATAAILLTLTYKFTRQRIG